MIRLIGGASRTGKGILSRRLLVQVQQPYLSLDVLKMGLANGVPTYGLDPEASSPEVAEKLWPLVHAMCVNMVESGVHYIVEGEILPKHAEELSEQYPGQIRACFLGYAEVIPEQKLQEIRQYGGHPNDWTADCPDAYVLGLVRDSIQFSRYLQSECSGRSMAYFDTSFAFADTLNWAAEYLTRE
jgi:hypothetical protein